MEPDPYQQAWRAQSSQTRVTVDADSLLRAVQRSQQGFRAIDLLGDVTNIGSLLLMLSVWIYMGAKLSLPWTWYLRVPVFIWSIGLTLVVRARQRRKPSEPGEPLLESVKESLALVEHRIWSTRNRFWWSELPAVIAMLAFCAHVSFTLVPSGGWLAAAGFFVFLCVCLFAVYGSAYFLNQRVTRKTYEPQRQELLALLASLGDETTSEVSGEYPIEIAQAGSVARLAELAQEYEQLMSAKRAECSPRRRFGAILYVVAILLFAVSAFLIIIGFAWWAFWKILTDT